MIDCISRLKYPFVYLDSSSILRCADIRIDKLTRDYIKRNPERYIQMLQKISLKDSNYYRKILRLQEKGLIEKVITMEVFNPFLKMKNDNIITLFGTVNNITLSSKNNSEWYLLDHLTFWNEIVDVKAFNTAALALVNAICVVADSAFFSISAGKTLADYIMTECPFFIASSEKNAINIEGNYTICKLSPIELIMRMSSYY